MSSVLVPIMLLEEIRAAYKQNKWEWYIIILENYLFFEMNNSGWSNVKKSRIR